MALVDLPLIGVPYAFLQNTVFALPARQVNITSTRAIQVSVDNSNWTADIAATTTGTQVTGVFARCTGGTGTLVCKV